MSASTVQKLALPALIAMVVGSMIGSGIFTLPSRFAGATGVYGALIAWVIAAGGMLMLAFVFQTLAARKPDIDSGIFAYASTASASTGVLPRRSDSGSAPASATSPTGC